MKRLRSRAARRALILLCALTAFAACTDMGAGADPKESEGTFLFALPPALKPSEIKPKAAEKTSEGGESLEDTESAAPQAKEEEPAPELAPQESAVALAPLPDNAPPAAPSPAEKSAAEADALAAESDALAGPLPDEPLEEGIAVSRYFLSMASAQGFSQYEEIEPSEEHVKLISQAGRWKIVATAEGPDGEALARCELTGVALSAGEERAVALEWEAP